MDIDVCLNRILARLQVSSKKVHYVGGNEALPPPLSKEEEEKLVNDLLNGDESIRSTLLERNLRLVV